MAKRLLLQVTHRHEDHAGVASAMSDQLMRTEMVMMKEMGVNFIRLGHYQQSRKFSNYVIAFGILVWGRNSVVSRWPGRQRNINLRQEAMLTNMIEQHYNHASVIMGGWEMKTIGLAIFRRSTKKIREFMKTLNDLSHQLDLSRKTAIRRCDFCKDIVDVYSPSIWAGWYRGVYTEYKKLLSQSSTKLNTSFMSNGVVIVMRDDILKILIVR